MTDAASTRIPRRLHAFWDGPPMPREHAGYLRRWQELHPDWGLALWDHDSYAAEFSNTRTYRYYASPSRWSPRSNVWQWRTNIARLELLARHGGVWIDTDLEPRRPIDELLERAEGGAFIVRESDRYVVNTFMGSTPRHPFVMDALARLPGSIEAGRQVRSNRSTGAQYLTPLVRRHPEVLVLPREVACPYRWDELHRRDEDFPRSYAVHRWHNRTEGERRRGRLA